MRLYRPAFALLAVAVFSTGCVPRQPHVDPSLPKERQAEIYIEWLRHIDPHVVFQGQHRLVELGEHAVPALTEALRDRDQCVRESAAQVLKDIRSDGTQPAHSD